MTPDRNHRLQSLVVGVLKQSTQTFAAFVLVRMMKI